ncbi:MAG TPA: hypothetical protein VGI10_08555 [Polyangiaceae bacterium]|jgi:hypothetical protein
MDDCAGTYTCALDTGSVSLTFSKNGEECSAPGLDLYGDGRGVFEANGAQVTWSGDANEFSLCEASCATCTRNTPGSAGAPGACAGQAKQCDLVGDCTGQRGCYYTVGDDPTSTADDGCAGTPDGCETFSEPARCALQIGCAWH